MNQVVSVYIDQSGSMSGLAKESVVINCLRTLLDVPNCSDSSIWTHCDFKFFFASDQLKEFTKDEHARIPWPKPEGTKASEIICNHIQNSEPSCILLITDGWFSISEKKKLETIFKRLEGRAVVVLVGADADVHNWGWIKNVTYRSIDTIIALQAAVLGRTSTQLPIKRVSQLAFQKISPTHNNADDDDWDADDEWS